LIPFSGQEVYKSLEGQRAIFIPDEVKPQRPCVRDGHVNDTDL
jgi:hypothetical protein